MPPSPEEYERFLAWQAAVTSLAESYRLRIDDANLHYVFDLIEHGEAGEALSILAWLLEDLPPRMLSQTDRQRLRDLADGLVDELPPSYAGMTATSQAWWLAPEA